MKFQGRYSRLDRLLHRFAFSTIEVQKALAGLEGRILTRNATDEDRHGEFEPFIESHLAKMVALQGGVRAGRERAGQGAGTSLSGAKSA